MRDDFRVGLGDEVMIRAAQAVFELKIVFDDAVVDDDDASGTVAVRVRVLFRWPPVRRPARVADAICAVERLQPYGLFEIAELALGAAYVEMVRLVNDRDACGVVAAILQLPQPVEDDRDDLFVSDVSDYPTHDC